MATECNAMCNPELDPEQNLFFISVISETIGKMQIWFRLDNSIDGNFLILITT